MKNLLPTPISSCISFVSSLPAAGRRPCFLFLSSKILERCSPAFVGLAGRPQPEGWRDLWEGGTGWMGSGKGACICSWMPGHKALPPSSDLGFTGGSGRALGCSAEKMGRGPRPKALLVLGTCRGPHFAGEDGKDAQQTRS